MCIHEEGRDASVAHALKSFNSTAYTKHLNERIGRRRRKEGRERRRGKDKGEVFAKMLLRHKTFMPASKTHSH